MNGVLRDEYRVLVEKPWAMVQPAENSIYEGHQELFVAVAGNEIAPGKYGLWLKMADIFPYAGDIVRVQFNDDNGNIVLDDLTYMPSVNHLLLMAQCAYNNGLLQTAYRILELCTSNIKYELPNQ